MTSHDFTIKPEPKSKDYLQNPYIKGTCFREYDFRGLMEDHLNPTGLLLLGQAYGTYCQRELDESRVVVGHDYRKYSQDLQRSYIIGLLSTGMHVIDVGLSTTPTVYFAQHKFDTKGGTNITASHNKNGWAGAKIASGLSRTLNAQEMVDFRKVVESGDFIQGAGTYERYDTILEDYISDLVEGRSLQKKFKIVFAAGNGTATFVGPDMLRSLGCEVIELDCEPDWDFPVVNPDPENGTFLDRLSASVKEHGADFGIGADGDGDRIGLIDNHGDRVYSDKIGLLIARNLAPKFPGKPVCIDVKSTGLYQSDPILAKHGNKVILVKTGHSYVKEAVREHDALAGLEKSGHWFFNPPLGRGYDDSLVGTIALLETLDDSEKTLSEMVGELPKTWNSPSFHLHCDDEIKYEVLDGLIQRVRDDAKDGLTFGGAKFTDFITINGIRFVLEDKSWGLIRCSSNTPSLVVVVESQTSEAQLREIVDYIDKITQETGKVGEWDQRL